MTNDPRDLNGNKLLNALQIIGRNLELREKMIELIKEYEPNISASGASVRDEITGPIVDALHLDSDVYFKKLHDGTQFKFLFRTKIARDFLLAKEREINHVWEPQTTKIMCLLAALRGKDVIVGGAYFGDQVILTAKSLMNCGGIVHGFEPNTDQAGMCEENARINNLKNVIVNKKGLWSKSGDARCLDGFDSFANSREAQRGEAGFQTISIDDYVDFNGIYVGLIQLDIEGAEFDALKGAEKTILRDLPEIVFEIHKSYVDWSDGLQKTNICRFLTDLGYSLFAIRDFNTHYDMSGRPIEIIPADRVYLEGPPHGFNMLALSKNTKIDDLGCKVVFDCSPKLLLHKDPVLHSPLDGF